MIEIALGLPHLRQGPIIRRALSLEATVLVSASALARWRYIDGCRHWTGWNILQLRNLPAHINAILDSGGAPAMLFTALSVTNPIDTIARLNDRARLGLDRTSKIMMTSNLLAKLSDGSSAGRVLAQAKAMKAARSCTFKDDSSELERPRQRRRSASRLAALKERAGIAIADR